MSIDSQNSKVSKEKDLEENKHEISELSDDNESMEVQDQNDNINKRSRIAQANKDIEAMNIIDKVKNFNLILILEYWSHLCWSLALGF